MNERRRRFEATVMPHLDAAYRFARWLVRPPRDAEDLVHDAFLRAYRGFDGWRGTDVKAWLFAIIRNCHLTSVHRDQRRAFVPLPDEHDVRDGHAMIAPAPDPETAAIHRDDARTLDRLVAALPEQYRVVLLLRELEEMGYREIAAVMNVPIGTVMSRLARARAALGAEWRRETKGEPHALC